jgi:sterol 3beta-glucosyltransferase
MKVVITSRGSRGDVQPFIEIAAALQQKGVQVSLCVPELFRKEITAKGLDARFYPEDSKELMVGLGSGTPSFKEALAFFSRSIKEQFDYMIDATADADILLTSVNEMAAPTVAEFRNIPYYRLGFAPILPGKQAPPLLPWQKLPSWSNQGIWQGINSVTGILIRKFINAKREELGLKKAPATNHYFTRKSHTLLGINEILAPPCPSWTKRYQFDYTGYCYSPPNGGLDPGLIDFIQSGTKPVYIGFGSVHMKQGRKLSQMIRQAVAETNCRVILGAGWTELPNGFNDDRIYPVGETCHASLFPLMAGIIHHGGSGTVHTTAKAGIPQLILPQIIDQHFWGHRIHQLGLGPKPVVPKRISTEKLMQILRTFSQETPYHNRAQEQAEKMEQEDGIDRIVSLLGS